MRQTFILLTILTTLLVSCTSYGQEKDDYSAKIDSLIKMTVQEVSMILITRKGKTKYKNAFGYSNIEKKTPLTTKTIYNYVKQ
jgi:hypothetical protein